MHAFLRFEGDQDHLIHLQGYPGFSTETEAYVLARLMDYALREKARQDPGVSVGNEHSATVSRFPGFGSGIHVPYNPATLLKRLMNDYEPVR